MKAGGCSGFSYEMFFGPMRVKVNAASAERLQGATLNFSDGIQGAGFSVDRLVRFRTVPVTQSCPQARAQSPNGYVSGEPGTWWAERGWIAVVASIQMYSSNWVGSDAWK